MTVRVDGKARPAEAQKVVITGISGYVGQRLASAVLDRTRASVLGIDKVPTTLRHPRLSFDQCDLAASTCHNAVRTRADAFEGAAVFHLAGLFVKDIAESFQISTAEYEKDNIVSTQGIIRTILECGAKPELFVFASTACIYDGSSNDQPCAVETAYPTVPYAQTKYDAEAELREMVGYVNRVFVLRLSRVVGLGEQPGLQRDIVSDFIEKLLDSDVTGTRCRIGSTGEARPYLHIDDLIELLLDLLAGDRGGGLLIRNVTPTDLTCVRDIANGVAEAMRNHRMLRQEPQLQLLSSVRTRVPVLNPMPYSGFQPRTSSSGAVIRKATEQYCRLLKELVEGQRFNDYLSALRAIRG